MKKYLYVASLCFMLFSIGCWFNSCKDDDPGKDPMPYCEIKEFKIPSLGFTGAIDSVSMTVTLDVAPDYDLDKLKSVAPSIQISPKATILPKADAVQDFTKDVKYTVTAENGTTKVWTVKMVLNPHVPIGIGNVNNSWMKTAAELGLSANAEATIATDGDLLVCSRSGLLIDGKTGTPKTEKLNMTGIVANPANAATNIAFTLVNDDAGNLVGCTLGTWGGAVSLPFKVYKWSAASAAPVEFISHPQSPTSHFGRKLAAVGDVTKKAIVTSYDCANENINKPGTANPGPANHAYWTITGGVAAAGQMISTSYNTGTYQQILWPASADGIKPYYFSDPGAADASPITTIKYKDASGVESTLPKGPVVDSDIASKDQNLFKPLGWGRKVLYTQLFNFNGKKYMGVLSYYDDVDALTYNYYIFILDLQDNYKPVFFDKKAYTGSFTGLNVNGTAGLAVSKVTEVDGTKTMRLYALFTSTAIVSYEIDNLAPKK